MKILFQGDSITDAGRNRDDNHDLGNGYPKYAAQYIKQAYPSINFEFIDLGVSGDQTKDLVARLQEDFIDINPDIVSILVGVNDTWHHAGNRDWIPNDVFEERYRTILTAIKNKTNAKIMMLEPFLIPVEDKVFFTEDLLPKTLTIRKLAREFADVYVPIDGLLAASYLGHNPTEYAADGVHPTPYGADFIGKKYAEAIAPIVESLK